MTPDITVVVATIARPPLKVALDSIRRQTYPGWRTVVVTDDKFQREPILEALAGDTRFSLVSLTEAELGKWYRHPHGAATIARNTGARRAETAFVAFLDDDNWYEPDHLELLWGTMLDHEADFGWSNSFLHGYMDLEACPRNSFYPNGRLDDRKVDVSEMMIRRQVFLDLGGFRTEVGWAVDGDLVDRLLKAKISWVHQPKPTMHFRWWRHNYSRPSWAQEDCLLKEPI